MTDLSEAASVRTEGDSWDITESGGATALSVAAARAVETATAEPLIRDEFAYLLVSTAGQPWARLASPGLDLLSGASVTGQADLPGQGVAVIRREN